MTPTLDEQISYLLEEKDRTHLDIARGNAHRVAMFEAVIDTLRAVKQAEPDTYGYACRLAKSIAKTHFKDTAPNLELLDTTLGVLTQIDNMVAGLPVKQAEPDGWVLRRSDVNELQADSINRLIASAKRAHYTDITLRINGANKSCEADWIKHLAAAPAAPQSGWQPIETAPKGPKVLVAYETAPGKWWRVLARYWPANTLESDHDESGFAEEGWYEATEAYEELMPVEAEPTFWHPLPAAPGREG